MFNYQSYFPTNSLILEAQRSYSGYVSKDGTVAAIPVENSKKTAIWGDFGSDFRREQRIIRRPGRKLQRDFLAWARADLNFGT